MEGFRVLPFIPGGFALVLGLLASYFLYTTTGIVQWFSSILPAPLTMNVLAGTVILGLFIGVLIKIFDAPQRFVHERMVAPGSLRRQGFTRFRTVTTGKHRIVIAAKGPVVGGTTRVQAVLHPRGERRRRGK